VTAYVDGIMSLLLLPIWQSVTLHQLAKYMPWLLVSESSLDFCHFCLMCMMAKAEKRLQTLKGSCERGDYRILLSYYRTETWLKTIAERPCPFEQAILGSHKSFPVTPYFLQGISRLFFSSHRYSQQNIFDLKRKEPQSDHKHRCE